MSCIHMRNLETDDLLENLTHKQMERIKRIICSSLCNGSCKQEYMEHMKPKPIRPKPSGYYGC